MNLTLNTRRALTVHGADGTITRAQHWCLGRPAARSSTRGATRATLVTCVFPVAGLVLGNVVLGEPIDWRLLAGTAMIVAGIVVVNACVFATLGSRAVSKN